MRRKTNHIAAKLHPKRVVETFPLFLKDEAAGGKLILVASLLALIAVNSPLREIYTTFWHSSFTLGSGTISLSLDLRHWVNEGLMAIFFLVVGLEIKREVVHGELRETHKIALPVAAALGGMVVPALMYFAINHQPILIQGWGIPIATDIAFAVAVVTLLGSRVPKSLKLFLLTLAIADDIGAIFVIALFYADIINYWFLAASAAIVTSLWLLRKHLARHMLIFICTGVVLWFTTHLSGIHASIIGAAIGLLAPMGQRPERPSIAKRLEDFFLPLSTFAVVPLFAFANAGVMISTRAFQDATSLSVMIGIILGLCVGKMVGITGATWLMVRYGKATLPDKTSWRQIVGVGWVAGIGFTVSIFITELAFGGNDILIEASKIAIFIASILSALLGSVILLRAKKV